jgi:hypothetical protein
LVLEKKKKKKKKMKKKKKKKKKRKKKKRKEKKRKRKPMFVAVFGFTIRPARNVDMSLEALGFQVEHTSSSSSSSSARSSSSSSSSSSAKPKRKCPFCHGKGIHPGGQHCNTCDGSGWKNAL